MPFIPSSIGFGCALNLFFATGSNKGGGVLVIWSVTFWFHPFLPVKAHQHSGQAIITSNTRLTHCIFTVQALKLICELINLPLKTLCHTQDIISSHLHDCGSEPAESPLVFSNWIPTNSRWRVRTSIHATITTIYWSISSIQQLIQCDTSVLTYSFLLVEAWGWNMVKVWPLVLVTVTWLAVTSLTEIFF